MTNFYKYSSYVKKEYQTVYKIKQRQKIVSIKSLVIQLGGEFQKIGGNNENAGGGDQKVG